jgi:eukaryotic-like serine/threonine-protein kinase
MAKPFHEPGLIIDGFKLEEMVHYGDMAILWRATRDDLALPVLVKVPRIGENADPAAIVSFEMEQMIMPRLSGNHVPRFVAAGEFSAHPYLAMDELDGTTLLPRLNDLPLPYNDVAEIGVKVATALDDLHRQHVVHLDIKPSNIMVRPNGDVVLLDFGLSHHEQLPDLMQEEFRLPFGTAPYMSPEQLRGIRNDPRSDIFALGVLLYFFSTGVRPFGESERLSGMRKRLWRDPVPPRGLRADYPKWLQEIVLRCLEIEPAWRYPTAAQLAFDLSHPDQVKLTARADKLRKDSFATVLRRRFNTDLTNSRATPVLSTQISSAPIVAVALDMEDASAPLAEALRITTERMLATIPSARLACLNVLKQGRLTLDSPLDERGHNKKIDRLVAMRHWAEPLKLDQERLTVHVLEAFDPASALLEFVRNNRVDHILIGARRDSLMRTLLGSVASKIAAEAPCTVTVVRPPRAVR